MNIPSLPLQGRSSVVPKSAAVNLLRERSAYDISVVLNIHRECLYLQRTLLSLIEAVSFARHRDGLTFELIAVVDRPDEQTRAWVSPEKFEDFDGCQIVEVSNGSLALSRNSGIQIANGAYVTTCDADDLVSYNMFSELYNVAESYRGETVAVFPEYLLAFGDCAHLCKYYGSDDIPAPAFFDYHPFISRVFINTEYAKAHPYKHADHKTGYAYEDWWFNSELMADDVPLLVAKYTTLYYRQRSGSLLREANSTSVRLIHPNRLLDPQRFISKSRVWRNIIPHGQWVPPESAQIRSDFFENPLTEATALAANRIDPAVSFSPGMMGSILSNLHGDAKMGIAYYDACSSLAERSYTDVVLFPFLTAGGGEKYILNVLNGLQKLGTSKRFLFLTGQDFDRHLWLDRLPENSDFLDVYQLCRGDLKALDIVTLRIIQGVGRDAKIHCKSCEFVHRFLSKYGSILEENEVIYYRFCDDVFFEKGELWTYGAAFNAFSENFNHLTLVVSDHQKLIDLDQSRLRSFHDKWKCIYTVADLPRVSWTPPVDQPKIKLMWASRICSQKRPELLVQLLHRLAQSMPNIEVHIFGKCDDGYSAAMFEGCPNGVYRGAFSDFYQIDLTEFSAFLYTSWFDGLPNVILEAMMSGLPVIAPNIGGIPEVIVPGSGWLVETCGDTNLDVGAYAEKIASIDFSPDALSSVSQQARRVTQANHSMPAFLERLKSVFVAQPTLEAAE